MSVSEVKDPALIAAMNRCDTVLRAAAEETIDDSANVLAGTAGQLTRAVSIHTGIPANDLGLTLWGLAERNQALINAGIPAEKLLFAALTTAFLTGYLAAEEARS